MLNLSLFMKLVLVKLAKTNLQKYKSTSPPYTVNAHVYFVSQQKDQQKVQILKETSVLCPSWWY